MLHCFAYRKSEVHCVRVWYKILFFKSIVVDGLQEERTSSVSGPLQDRVAKLKVGVCLVPLICNHVQYVMFYKLDLWFGLVRFAFIPIWFI